MNRIFYVLIAFLSSSVYFFAQTQTNGNPLNDQSETTLPIQNDCYCSSEFAPVCVNGTTYQNSCIAQCLGFFPSTLGSCSPNDLAEILACQSDCVWPGDVNNDGQVTPMDIAFFYAIPPSSGFARIHPQSSWAGFPATDWLYNFNTGLNYKFADCNGDGFINNEDLAVIQAHLGFSSSNSPNNYQAGHFTIEVEVPATASAGDTVEIPILLGTVSEPIANFYSLNISLNYSPGTVVPHSAQLNFKGTWLGEPYHLQYLVQDFSFCW